MFGTTTFKVYLSICFLFSVFLQSSLYKYNKLSYKNKYTYGFETRGKNIITCFWKTLFLCNPLLYEWTYFDILRIDPCSKPLAKLNVLVADEELKKLSQNDLSRLWIKWIRSIESIKNISSPEICLRTFLKITTWKSKLNVPVVRIFVLQ